MPADRTMQVTSTRTYPMRLVLAGFAVLISASIVGADWIVILPPMTRKPTCEVVYDKAAPIAKWQRQPWGPFDTLDACEALRQEMAKRTTAPGRRERAVALGQERREQALEMERQLRRDAKHDSQKKQLLRMLPRHRRSDPRLCDITFDDWTDSRCLERADP
jgi:hypothetical protein